jgi:hypothetical protein
MRHQLDRAQNFFWHRLRWRVVSAYLPRDRPFRLIDVGAGTGILGEFLRRERPNASYGFVEPIGFLESHLEERYGIAANAKGLVGLGDANFVALLDVLEHQEDDRTFLAELVSGMRPGATFLMTVPASQRLWSSWDIALGHYRRYDKQMLFEQFGELPVEVCEVSYLFPEMLPPAVLRARLRPANDSADATAEFPELPAVANWALYAIGRATVPLRRMTPMGTSVFAAVVRR